MDELKVKELVLKHIYTNSFGYSVLIMEDKNTGEISEFISSKDGISKRLSFIKDEVMQMELDFYRRKKTGE